MLKYAVKRLLYMIPVLIGVTFLVFVILSLAPGDPAALILGNDATPEAIAQLRGEMGLDDPILIQYGRYMWNLLHGDMGTSYVSRRAVTDEVMARYPSTLKLALVSGAVAIILSIPLGIIAAIKQNTIFDNMSMVISLIGISMPAFWLALMLMLLFSLKLGWLPAQGALHGWKSYVLPSISIGFMNMAAIARTTRSTMLETIRQDYVRTAYAKGLSKRVVITQHALRNAIIPIITVVGIQLAGLLGGAVLTETVFAWPGLGRLMVQSVNARDVPMVTGCVVIMSVTCSLLNLAVDLMYGLFDPRTKSIYS